MDYCLYFLILFFNYSVKSTTSSEAIFLEAGDVRAIKKYANEASDGLSELLATDAVSIFKAIKERTNVVQLIFWYKFSSYYFVIF